MISKSILSGYAGFFTAGFTLAAWAPLIPFVKEALNLEPINLGAMLLALGLGSLVGMPLAGKVSAKYGSRAAIGASGAASCGCLVLLAMMPSYALECIFLFTYGVVLGCLEVSVNIYGSFLERSEGRRLMSGFHANYSIGEVCAAALMSGTFYLGFSPFQATVFWMAVLTAGLAYFVPGISNFKDESKHGGGFRWPNGVVWKLSLLIAVMFMAEGGMLDWSALFLRVEAGVPIEEAGFGYTLFVIAMASARIFGDRLASRFGGARLVAGGAALMTASLAVMVFFPSKIVGFAALFTMGLGIANMVPLLVSAAGRQKDMPALAAITSSTTIGYAGLTMGPVLIGGVSQATSISTAFLCVAVLVFGTVAACRQVNKIL